MLDKVFLEITSACNLACPFCPPTRRAAEFMRPELFELLLERLRPHSTHLYFHLKGEPLLHPSLGTFLDEAGAQGFAVSLVTNGTLLGERAEELLARANIRKLSASLHSRVGTDALETYWRGIESFLDRHRQNPAFPVSLRLWNRRAGRLPPETAALWELLRARYPHAGEAPGEDADSVTLDHRVFANMAEEYRWPSIALDRGEDRGFCRGLRNQIGVLVDGRVVPCCMDGDGDMALGSLVDESLDGILSSPRARAIYDGFTARRLVEPLCRSCGYRERFSRAMGSSGSRA